MVPSTDNQRRRMADKTSHSLDAAVRMERLEGQQNLLAQQVKASLDAMTSALNTVQLETRAVTNKLGDIVSIQHSQDSNKTAIDDMRRSLGDLNTRLEEWLDDFDQRSQRRWEQYEKNRDQWRREHEADNEDTKRELENEIRNVRERMIQFVGFSSAIGALAGVIVGGFLWNINYRFSEQDKDVVRIESTSSINRRLIDAVNSELIDIKLYLARGGRIPAEPYVPQSQRNQHGNEQPAK